MWGGVRGGVGRGGGNSGKGLAGTVGGGLALSNLTRSGGAASGVRVLQSPEQPHSAYDYVIVGAGSAGCALAHRLGLAGRRALLLEAARQAKRAPIPDPPERAQRQGRQVDWCYLPVPQSRRGGPMIRR